MKLFQRLLVAPAALGLMAPIAANADIAPTNFESEVTEARIDSVEAQLNEIQAGAFSSTTTLSGKAAFVVGSLDDDQQTGTDSNNLAVTGGDELTMNYMYQLNVNSSFTGEDLLYTRIKTGNFEEESASAAATGTTSAVTGNYGRFSNKGNGDYLAVSNQNGNVLEVDKIWYQFPVGDSLQVWVGPKIENYYMLASAPSIYKPVTKQFALGGNASTYGSSTSPGFGAAWTQQVEDPSEGRLGVSINYTAKNGAAAATGINNDDGQTFLLSKIEYGTPQWQVSAAFASKTNGETYDGYYHTAEGEDYDVDLNSVGLRAYWKPDSSGAVPQVQLGFDMAKADDAVAGQPTEMQAWMIGLGWTDLFMDGNRGGFALGSRQHATEYNGTGSDVAKDNRVWEAYYSFKINDGVTITPALFGGTDLEADGQDVNGALVQTEFRF